MDPYALTGARTLILEVEDLDEGKLAWDSRPTLKELESWIQERKASESPFDFIEVRYRSIPPPFLKSFYN
jgi:hypothetical protein